MKYKLAHIMKTFLLLLVLITLWTSCQKKDKSQTDNTDFRLHKVKVDGLIQVENYTYLKVSENNKEFWMAISKQELKEGDVLFFNQMSVSEQIDFKSEELNRTFDTILFVSQVSQQPITTEKSEGSTCKESGTCPAQQVQTMTPPPGHTGGKVAPIKKEVTVKSAQGGILISELFANKSKYANKKIKIKGVVVKVNSQIMGRNWVHIQDGTSFANDFDLTITTQETVKVNDEVTFEGIIALDKDFTSGYFYNVIMEEAILVLGS